MREKPVNKKSNCIDNMAELEYLVITAFLGAEKKIQKLPSSIVRLKNLKLLDVSHNSLLDLPEDIGRLKKLEKLNLINYNEMHEFFFVFS